MNLPTIILRHQKENRKKCSLRGLEKREDCQFFTYPKAVLPPLDSYILLKVGAPPLTEKDQDCGIFLIDGTWKLASVMEKNLPEQTKSRLIERSLPPSFRTAYPRHQTACPDPESGLASIEALYIAYSMLKRPLEGLLDHYYWKEPFLEKNLSLLKSDSHNI